VSIKIFVFYDVPLNAQRSAKNKPNFCANYTAKNKKGGYIMSNEIIAAMIGAALSGIAVFIGWVVKRRVDNPDTRETSKLLLHKIYEPLDSMLKTEQCTYGKLEAFILRAKHEHHAIFPDKLDTQFRFLHIIVLQVTTAMISQLRELVKTGAVAMSADFLTLGDDLESVFLVSEKSTPEFYKYIVSNYNYLKKKLHMPYDKADIYVQYTPMRKAKQIELAIACALQCFLYVVSLICIFSKSIKLADEWLWSVNIVVFWISGYITARTRKQ
jgi:hypothetical protein